MIYKINQKTEVFLKKYVFSRSSFKTITENNAEEIVNFIILNYVSPLTNFEEEINIDDDLLNAAEDAITDITSNPLW